MSKEAAFIDAVNTIIKSKDKLHALSTDGEGLIKDLFEKNIQLTKKKILIIGAGAAAQSVRPQWRCGRRH